MRPAMVRTLVAVLGLAVASLSSAATINIQVMDAPGEGFNDTSPFTPIGANNATTLGQARLNVFREAARLWGQLISSNITIVVEASFDPLDCSANSGVLGSAGPLWMFHDFPNAPVANVFYPAALADALSNQNLAAKPDISAAFNSTVNGTVGCLGGSYLYYGFDHQLTGHSDNRSYIADLLGVVLHELGHGLGFVSIVDQNGAGVAGTDNVTRLGVFEQSAYEESLNMYWPQMSAAQRAQSAIGQSSAGNATLVWNAANVNSNLSRLSLGSSASGHLRLFAPTTFDASSSVSHWDSSATPDLLMESRYSTRTGNHTDLTTCALYDMGWQGTRCPDGVTASAQTVAVIVDTPLNITLGASDGNADALTYTIVAAPMHGTLGALNGAVVRYTPAAGFTGADQFSFKASDALVSSNTAIVSITVGASAGGGGGGGGGTGSTKAATNSGGGGLLDLFSLFALAVCAALRGRQASSSGRARDLQGCTPTSVKLC